MTVTHQRIQRLVGIACLSALAFILMFFEFPILPMAPYLKLDFSDVPVLLGGYIYGPVGGVIIALLKCLIHGMVHGFSPAELIGIFSDFLSALAMLLPFCWVWHHQEWSKKKQAITGIILSTVILTTVMSLLNLWVLTPLYMAVWNWKSTLPVAQLVAIGVLPFNIIKGLVVTIVYVIIADRLQSWLDHHRTL
ncbi:ECF transporter S component [Limosilactobacillus sp. STM2_1]|uniref:Riboflavin transporter n=1 Tax=Limosilactobacillus rudii TaxID=2759755 RepID=A0A7W3UK86_9LACO|nr:ECF transporter S component [Limosilactobacillus rudii]MBB1079084.1 ECF transporter S component [Limosilactobacillus rudii]MBB1097041.1 ECF transporter S component [Limosilactobacillus rudii]MCD7134009.1 ECF transporter S component [Limosilactobacillus rudii]